MIKVTLSIVILDKKVECEDTVSSPNLSLKSNFLSLQRISFKSTIKTIFGGRGREH